jgi:hypothetical protein
MAERYASLAPSTFVQGGLLNNVDVEVTGAVFCRFDYQGHADEIPALRLDCKPLDGGNVAEQFLSAGNLKDWLPSADGERLVAAGEDTPQGLNNTCNLAIFMGDLVKCGYNEAKLNEPASSLVGLQFHVVRKKVEGRGGGNVSDKEVMRVARIIKLPWENKPGTRTGATPAKAAPADAATSAAPATATGAGVSDEIKALVAAAIPVALNGSTTMKLSDLKKAVFQQLTSLKTSQRGPAVKLLDDDGFRGENMLSLEGDTISVLQF